MSDELFSTLLFVALGTQEWCVAFCTELLFYLEQSPLCTDLQTFYRLHSFLSILGQTSHHISPPTKKKNKNGHLKPTELNSTSFYFFCLSIYLFLSLSLPISLTLSLSFSLSLSLYIYIYLFHQLWIEYHVTSFQPIGCTCSPVSRHWSTMADNKRDGLVCIRLSWVNLENERHVSSVQRSIQSLSCTES